MRCPAAHILQPVSFQADAFADPPLRRQRMSAAGLFVTLDQGCVSRFQKQDLGHHRFPVHFAQHMHQFIKKLAAADIDNQGDPADPTG